MYAVFQFQGHNEPNNESPIWIKHSENAFGCAYKVFCGQDYSVILCGALMVPYFLGGCHFYPTPIMDVTALNTTNTQNVICTKESIIFAKTNQTMMKISTSDINDITIIDHLSLLPDMAFVMGLMEHLNESSTPFYLSNERFTSLTL